MPHAGELRGSGYKSSLDILPPPDTSHGLGGQVLRIRCQKV